MSRARTKCVSAKVTGEEYVAIVDAAGEQPLSAWARTVMLSAIDANRPSVEHVLVEEIVALRTIVLNLHFALASGEKLTPETMQRLIERADHDKIRKAQERLASSRRWRRP